MTLCASSKPLSVEHRTNRNVKILQTCEPACSPAMAARHIRYVFSYVMLNGECVLCCVFRAGGYWWWIPVAGPMMGGVLGAMIYYLLIELHHLPEEKHEEKSNVQDKYEMITMS